MYAQQALCGAEGVVSSVQSEVCAAHVALKQARLDLLQLHRGQPVGDGVLVDVRVHRVRELEALQCTEASQATRDQVIRGKGKQQDIVRIYDCYRMRQ